MSPWRSLCSALYNNRMPGGSYRRRLGSLLSRACCTCDVNWWLPFVCCYLPEVTGMQTRGHRNKFTNTSQHFLKFLFVAIIKVISVLGAVPCQLLIIHSRKRYGCRIRNICRKRLLPQKKECSCLNLQVYVLQSGQIRKVSPALSWSLDLESCL